MREEIIKLLDQYRLKEALSQMTGYATHTSDWQLKNELEALQTSYDLMLQYTSKGMKDPNKVEIYHKMLRTAYELADRIHIAVQATQNYGAYYDTMRTFVQSPPHSYAELQMQLEAYTEDMATAPLIYTTEAKINEEMDAMRKRHETAVDELFEKIWVSTRWSESEYAEAQTLFNSLLIQVNDLSIMVSAVTMSLLQIFDIRKFMFLLNAYTHQDTMLNQRAIAGIALTCYYYEKRILQYPEAVSRINELNENAEFIKNLHHIQIQLLQSSRETRKIDKKMREEIIPEMMKNPKLNLEGLDEDAEDHNPEWEEWIDRSGITDKLRELGELQMSGADVYMSTFSQLKQFPFFRKISHWFYPFDPQYQDIAKLSLSQALLHKEYINKLADYLFTHDDLAEAGILYDKSIELYNRKNAELWQKAGFIYQKIGSYKKAIDYYLQSDLLIPDNTWNNRHLAQCYRKEGNYPKALEYYNKVEQAQPDSLNLALQIGQCLMALERYDEALAYFFKVEYLDKKPQNARRAIGWCSFITGNHQQAKKYYDLLISEPKPIMEDWMNAGHVYYILNETEKSIEYYRKAQELCDSHDEFVRLYQIDKKDLIKQGANEVDLFILPDELI